MMVLDGGRSVLCNDVSLHVSIVPILIREKKIDERLIPLIDSLKNCYPTKHTTEKNDELHSQVENVPYRQKRWWKYVHT